MGYIGNIPAEKFSSFSKQTFTPDGSTTSFPLDYSVSGENELELFVNNVRQEPGSGKAYTASGTTLTMSEAPGSSDTMYAVFQGKAVQTVTPASNSVTNDMLAGSIATSKLANQNIGFRNLIINGDMSIAQRGTSVTGLANSPAFIIDRFSYRRNGTWTAVQYTMSQETDAPTGQGFVKSLKITPTTAEASVPNGAFSAINYAAEGQDLQLLKYGTSNAESLTLSFWVKSNKTGTYVCAFLNVSASKLISKAYTIDSSNTWEKKSITIPGDTVSSYTNDNTVGLNIYWGLAAGTDWTSGSLSDTWQTSSNANFFPSQTVNLADNTANEWYITGVQLEVGTSASDFEFLPHDVNFQRCARYFQQTRESSDRLSFSGKANGDTRIDFAFPLVVPLRNTPTASQSGTEWRAWRPTSDLAQSSATFTVQSWVENNPWVALRVDSFPSSSFTNNYLVGIGPSNLYINLDAEL